eukprot:4144694-Amphidinium_carterae.1
MRCPGNRQHPTHGVVSRTIATFGYPKGVSITVTTATDHGNHGMRIRTASSAEQTFEKALGCKTAYFVLGRRRKLCIQHAWIS